MIPKPIILSGITGSQSSFVQTAEGFSVGMRIRLVRGPTLNHVCMECR
jgi:hypothetical protein